MDPKKHAQSSDSDEEDQEDSGSDEMSGSDEHVTWIQWFCSLKGNEYFCEVEDEYIQDDFNLTGLSSVVSNYELALDLILDAEQEEKLPDETRELVEQSAELLYGLVHARYILSSRGLATMYEKYMASEFGRCARVHCQNQPVLPVGLSDVARQHPVKLYCPRCRDVYHPPHARYHGVDGAYFGTSFAHLLLLSYPEGVPAPPVHQYTPRIYGFKLHQPRALSPASASASSVPTAAANSSSNIAAPTAPPQPSGGGGSTGPSAPTSARGPSAAAAAAPPANSSTAVPRASAMPPSPTPSPKLQHPSATAASPSPARPKK